MGAEGGGNVEMRKTHAVLCRRASWIRRSRQRPLPVCRTRSRVRWPGAAGVFASGALTAEAVRPGVASAGTTWTRQISWSTSPWPLPKGARCSSAHHWRRSNQCTGSAQTEYFRPPHRSSAGRPSGPQTTSTDSLNMPTRVPPDTKSTCCKYGSIRICIRIRTVYAGPLTKPR
jgi:hypothetical protein